MNVGFNILGINFSAGRSPGKSPSGLLKSPYHVRLKSPEDNERQGAGAGHVRSEGNSGGRK